MAKTSSSYSHISCKHGLQNYQFFFCGAQYLSKALPVVYRITTVDKIKNYSKFCKFWSNNFTDRLFLGGKTQQK